MVLKIRQKTFIFAMSLALSLLAFAASEQVYGQRNPDITRRELRNFDRFLDAHPEIDADLQKDPTLVNNQQYLDAHPALRDFLAKHPGVREELKETPRYFMLRERRFERHGGDITRQELRNFDRFLDAHPEIAEDLRKNPKLIDDQNYLANHPALNDFLAKHPGVRKEVAENPRLFMRRERRFERHERIKRTAKRST
jgi:GrpB-like predicted nucleotidyltransferase (UPF0157 family)